MTPDPFAGIAPLVQAGRFKEAAAALKLSARAGARPWEAYIWLGRIEENRGRLGAAEAAFRRALNAAPASPLPRVELSRLLEKAGRGEEAQEVLRAAAAQAAGELTVLSEDLLGGEGGKDGAGSLYSLMEFNLYRKVFLDVIRKGEGLERIEKALRSVVACVPQAGARTLLAEVLIAQGRRRPAAAELAAAFSPGATGAETSRLEVLLALIDGGCYPPVLERAVLSAVAAARPEAKLLLEWPKLFSALMCARRYLAAFRLGEAMLDRTGGFSAPQHLMWPWWRRIARAVSEHAFLESELARIRAAGRSGRFPRWFAYYRAILLSDQGGDNKAAMAEYERIPELSSPRYSWMCQSFVLVKLGLLDFDGAVAVCRAVLSGAPSHWWVRCRMGEAYLAKGDRRLGLRQFEDAERADPESRKEVLTWHGEVLLWLGEYGKSLEKLDAAVALGAKTFVFGWRGAARLLTGDAAGALADLDRAVALDPKDFEARAWRGEAHRLAGRTAEAAADLDLVVAGAPDVFWARFNRALLNDDAGLAEDFAAIPAEVTSFVAGGLGLPSGRPLEPEEMRRVLRSGLERAKGIRRWERFVQCIWMGAPG